MMRSFTNQKQSICLIGLIFINLMILGVHCVPFDFSNNCNYPVWPATLTAANVPAISNTGFAMQPGEKQSLDVPASWSGRIWPRTQCSGDTGTFTCITGDCGTKQVACNGLSGNPPATLIEMTLNGNGDNSDTYDISLVDGFNVPLSITPQSGSGCTTSSCKNDVNANCPSQLVLQNAGQTVGCKSACAVFNTDEYCCRGAHTTTETCPPTDFSKYFKSQCPQAYSYAKDDQSSTFSCPSGSGYTITFCP